MSKLQLRIIKRAINTRLNNGEEFDEIIIDYPKLSEEEISQLRLELDIVEE